MPKVIIDIKLDTVGANTFRAIVAKQWDSQSRYLLAKITQSNTQIIIAGTSTVLVTVRRSDNAVKSFVCEVTEDGKVKIPLTRWMLSEIGTHTLDLKIIDNNSALTTTMFYVEVEESINNGEIVFDDEEYDALTVLASGMQTLSHNVTSDEAERVEAEINRVNAEVGRVSAEASRAAAETARITAETERETAETDRISAEAERKTAETIRAFAEAERITNETSRTNAEVGRVNAETARVSAETNRASAETARTAAEANRTSAETARASAETARASAETNRASAETARASAEANRASAEANRASAEALRSTAETAREQAEALRQANTATAVQNANTAREAALAAADEMSIENEDDNKNYTYKFFVRDGHFGITTTEI